MDSGLLAALGSGMTGRIGAVILFPAIDLKNG